MPEMVVLLTPACLANSTLLVGPRSKSACKTRPRLAEPTSDDDRRERAALDGRPSSRASPSSRLARKDAARPIVNKLSASLSIVAQLRRTIDGDSSIIARCLCLLAAASKRDEGNIRGSLERTFLSSQRPSSPG